MREHTCRSKVTLATREVRKCFENRSLFLKEICHSSTVHSLSCLLVCLSVLARENVTRCRHESSFYLELSTNTTGEFSRISSLSTNKSQIGNFICCQRTIDLELSTNRNPTPQANLPNLPLPDNETITDFSTIKQHNTHIQERASF